MPPESRVGGAEIAGSEKSNEAENLLPTKGKKTPKKTVQNSVTAFEIDHLPATAFDTDTRDLIAILLQGDNRSAM